MLTSQFTDQYKYLTSSIKFSYSDVKLISETQLYYLYEGKSKYAPYQSHTIRAFNFNSAFAQENYDAAASLFIKELLHLVSIDPTIVLVNTFEINDKKMAFAALTYAPISQITQNLISNKGTKEDTSQSEFSSMASIKDLISKVLLEVEYLSKELKIQDCSSILTPQSIYRCKESGKYFLGDWLTAIMKDGQMSTEIGTNFSKQSDAPVKPREILSLGLSIFELNRVNAEIIKRLREMEEKKDILFGPVVNGLFSTKELDGVPEELKNLLEMMVDSNESKRLKCIEFHKYSSPIHTTPSPTKTLSKDVFSDLQLDIEPIETRKILPFPIGKDRLRNVDELAHIPTLRRFSSKSTYPSIYFVLGCLLFEKIIENEAGVAIQERISTALRFLQSEMSISRESRSHYRYLEEDFNEIIGFIRKTKYSLSEPNSSKKASIIIKKFYEMIDGEISKRKAIASLTRAVALHFIMENPTAFTFTFKNCIKNEELSLSDIYNEELSLSDIYNEKICGVFSEALNFKIELLDVSKLIDRVYKTDIYPNKYKTSYEFEATVLVVTNGIKDCEYKAIGYRSKKQLVEEKS